MAGKIILFLTLAVVGALAVTEIRLQDVTTSHTSSVLHPMPIGIGISFADQLESCHVIFPTGLMYELYPSSQTLTHSSMINNAQNGIFPSCGMFFLNAPSSLSGTYELLSLVQHIDSTRTLSRQRYHITFVQSEVEVPSDNLV